MNSIGKIILAEVWFLLVVPVLGVLLVGTLGRFGVFLFIGLVVVWCWELFAYANYRTCRQEEFLHVLQAAAATQSPLESVLVAYLEDRPRERLYFFWVGTLLFFIFPGWYWIHRRRRFDARINQLAAMLEKGIPLDRALGQSPGLVSRETALAVSVGQFSGQLALALHRLPSQRAAPLWVELLPRLLYPLFILTVMVWNTAFVTIFILPKFEKIFAEFHVRLPPSTVTLIQVSRWFLHSFVFVLGIALNLLLLVNLVLFNSRAKWYFPLLGLLYRLRLRGQFLHLLGLMLETGKPLPQILDRLNASGLLPTVLTARVEQLGADLQQGEPLVGALVRNGLATESMRGLIVAAEKTQNLPWALQELGDALTRRYLRLVTRLTMVLFPVLIFACACLIGFVAVSLFEPLIALIESQNG